LVGERLSFVFVASANGFEDRFVFQIKEVVCLAVTVAVGSAHETITDHSNI
jgi:hypothetical protein